MELLDNNNYQLLKFFYEDKTNGVFDLFYDNGFDATIYYKIFEKNKKHFVDQALEVLYDKGFITNHYNLQLKNNTPASFSIKYKITPTGRAFYEFQTREIQTAENRDQFTELEKISYDDLFNIKLRNFQWVLVKREAQPFEVDTRFPEYVKVEVNYDSFLEQHDYLLKNKLIELTPFYLPDCEPKIEPKNGFVEGNPLGYILSVSRKGFISLEKYEEKLERKEEFNKTYELAKKTDLRSSWSFWISIGAVLLTIVINYQTIHSFLSAVWAVLTAPP